MNKKAADALERAMSTPKLDPTNEVSIKAAMDRLYEETIPKGAMQESPVHWQALLARLALSEMPRGLLPVGCPLPRSWPLEGETMIPEAIKTVCHCGKQFCGMRGWPVTCDCGRRITIGEPVPKGYGGAKRA